MAGPGAIQVPPDSTGKLVDAISMAEGATTVYRQKVVLTGGSGTAEQVAVVNIAPPLATMGIVTHHAGPVSLTGTAIVSGLVSITGTVAVSGLVSLTGTAVVAWAVPQVVNNISATVTVSGSINISATAPVAGTLNLSGSVVASGTFNIFAMGDVPSASRGPRTILVSTSANATLVAAPGANLAIYVTGLVVTNASGINTRARVGPSASIGQVTVLMAQSGGGAVMNFTPPWQLSTNEALLGSVKPNASEGIFTVHFFVASADAA